MPSETAPRVDRYEIKGRLGAGAFGVVYLAVDPKLEREVAVKVISPDIAADPEVRKRFNREAKSTARLHHSNIIEVYDYSGAESAVAYMVVERLRGQTLQQVVADRVEKHGRALPTAVAAAAAHEICLALEHAHNQNIIHRDLKPENIFLEPEGRLVLTDFGIARAFRSENEGTLSGPQTQLLGSPLYMSPEQVNNPELLGPPSDYFALGSVLYFLITGECAFNEDSVLGVLKRIIAGAHHPIQGSTSMVRLIEDLLTVDIDKRLTDPDKVTERLIAIMRESSETDPRRLLKKGLADEVTLITAVTPLDELDAHERTQIVSLAHSLSTSSGVHDIREARARQSSRENSLTETMGSRETKISSELKRGLTGSRETQISREHYVSDTYRHRKKRSSAWIVVPVALGVGAAAYGAYELFKPDDAITVHVPQPPPPQPQPEPEPKPQPPPEPKPQQPEPKPQLPPQPDPQPPSNPQPEPHHKPQPQPKPPHEKPQPKPPPQVVSGPGSIKLVALPWAYVFIDGEKVGTTPGFRTATLPAGRHRLKLVNPAFTTVEREFEIKAGEETHLQFNLE